MRPTPVREEIRCQSNDGPPRGDGGRPSDLGGMRATDEKNIRAMRGFCLMEPDWPQSSCWQRGKSHERVHMVEVSDTRADTFATPRYSIAPGVRAPSVARVRPHSRGEPAIASALSPRPYLQK
jgi:hypothetical protein